ncbi:hydrogenase nickel incorporation protein HypB [Shewanella zhangzhouensis]|uniref:hydrogenase nickel incorporation protein HypB n=1 Tax=Shewanella zhangzhouensis TaxID=2864213 RepID=UPI001C65673B|nr:hydrogenase nickel incorporation protein HypB [Shewanella zhangzhouensis]QYK06916.1 hydrogenase nickel incorporation protein HypB [Shewanella zhangzhouensis]
MCQDCGCSLPRFGMQDTHQHAHEHHELTTNPQLNDARTLSVIHKILDKNDVEATHNRSHFEARQISAYNLMSSPGSGKTTLLECLHEYLGLTYGVIEGDLETSKDADRLLAKGIQAVQIQTGSACHLDAFMVHGALHRLTLDEGSIAFIENVGNLVCPASYDVGTHRNIVLLSVPEGDDKIAKYPVMFRRADLVLITKSDLTLYFDFSMESAKESLRALNPQCEVIELSIKDGRGMDRLAAWLKQDHSARYHADVGGN